MEYMLYHFSTDSLLGILMKTTYLMKNANRKTLNSPLVVFSCERENILEKCVLDTGLFSLWNSHLSTQYWENRKGLRT